MLNQTLATSLLAGLLATGCVESTRDAQIDDALTRLAAEHDGKWQLGQPLYAADDAAGPHVVALERDTIANKLAFDAAYRARVRAEVGDEAHPITPYAVIGTDSRVIVDTPRSYPYSKHVVIVMQRPNESLAPERRDKAYYCSGTFLDEDFVLTAAHCVYNRDEGHWAYANTDRSVQPSRLDTQWGTDYGRGYVCLGGDVNTMTDFAGYCEFVSARWTNLDWINVVGDEWDSDYALLKLERANHSSGMGAGRWMAMSDLDSGGSYQNQIAVINGFPTEGPDSSIGSGGFWVTDSTISDPNLRTAFWEFPTSVNLYHRHSAVDSATTKHHLEYTADTSGGDSGAAVFYYSDGASDYNGQSHYIMGVHEGEIDTNLNGGTAVHEFRDWVTTTMSAN
jgi:V8-like Glu-specific endopeptidase